MKRFCSILFLIFSLFFLSDLRVFTEEKIFEPADFKERRDKLSSIISNGVAIISNAAGLMGRRGPNPGFYYLTGVDVPEAKLILIPKEIAARTLHPESWPTTIYLPSRNPRWGVWDDPQLFAGEEAVRVTGIENNADLSIFFSDLAKLGEITEIVYLSYGTAVESPLGLPQDLQFVESIKKILPGVKIKNLLPFIDELRWKKSVKEIEIMKKASAITVEAFKEAARMTKPGIYEYEIEALVSYIFRKNGAQGAAFTIIGSGPNSCILHHMKNDRQAKDGELLVIDIGPIYKSLSMDLTRTIPVSGKFSVEQRKIYSIVLEAQRKAISIVKPGVTLADVHQTAMEVIDQAGYGKYFIHGTSHSLNGGSPYGRRSFGLRSPEMLGKYRMDIYFAADNPLQPGSVFTVEPGIYIPEKNLGIRIEDDILVTENGFEILTQNAPKEIEEIEKLMKEKPLIK